MKRAVVGTGGGSQIPADGKKQNVSNVASFIEQNAMERRLGSAIPVS